MKSAVLPETEAQFQRWLTDYLDARGWLWHHTADSRRRALTGDPGFPDLVATRDGRLLFIECKTAHGSLSPSQRHWANDLEMVPGVHYYCWRPTDRDRIEQTLE